MTRIQTNPNAGFDDAVAAIEAAYGNAVYNVEMYRANGDDADPADAARLREHETNANRLRSAHAHLVGIESSRETMAHIAIRAAARATGE